MWNRFLAVSQFEDLLKKIVCVNHWNGATGIGSLAIGDNLFDDICDCCIGRIAVENWIRNKNSIPNSIYSDRDGFTCLSKIIKFSICIGRYGKCAFVYERVLFKLLKFISFITFLPLWIEYGIVLYKIFVLFWIKD